MSDAGYNVDDALAFLKGTAQGVVSATGKAAEDYVTRRLGSNAGPTSGSVGRPADAPPPAVLKSSAPVAKTSDEQGLPTWAVYSLVGIGLLIAGGIVVAAIKR